MNWFEECERTTMGWSVRRLTTPCTAASGTSRIWNLAAMISTWKVAWAEGHEGEGVNVVVVDTTIDYGHEDLTDNVDFDSNHDFGGLEGISSI